MIERKHTINAIALQNFRAVWKRKEKQQDTSMTKSFFFLDQRRKKKHDA